VLERYRDLEYPTLLTSAVTGEGIDSLREVLKDKASVIAGQSGVGKSSLLNVVQPGLKLRIGDIIEQIGKGRHTTSTASLIRLEVGGYVVDTPGIRSFDLSIIPRNEFEAYFVEFVYRLADCKFPDCTHRHESDCAIKAAVERGEIRPERYESYVQMFEEPGTGDY
jgi:ribosome biogenesis GTPase